MNGRKWDIAVAGGGLSGGMIALALARHRPDMDVVLIEQERRLGGGNSWFWFPGDLPREGAELLSGLRKTEWDRGCWLRFPAGQRKLSTACAMLVPADFEAGLRRSLPAEAILTGRTIAALAADGVALDDGTQIAARTVIDCRGFVPSAHLTGGWRASLSRNLQTAKPHGMTAPVIMDGSIDDDGQFRFARIFPLGLDHLLVEENRYVQQPMLDRAALSRRIDSCCASHGIDGTILGSTSGIRPILTGGDFAACQAEHRIEGVAVAGTRALLVHPLTGESLPHAVDMALAIAADADLAGTQLAALTEARARRHWRRTGFYRRRARILLGAASPQQQQRLFESLYGLPQPLIERFHAARSTALDRARIASGGSLARLAGKGGRG